MILNERIRVRIYRYDHSKKEYVDVYEGLDKNGNKTNCLYESCIISASIKRQCCPDGAFAVGGVFAATLSLVVKIPNMSLFRIRGSKISIWSKYDTETDWYRLGSFWVTDASRIGNIYTLHAQDAVGWLDTSSYNIIGEENAISVGAAIAAMAGGTGKTIQQWLSILTDATNRFIQAQTGVEHTLAWQDYDVSKNKITGLNREVCDYCNSHIWADGMITVYDTQLFLHHSAVGSYAASGTSNSDCPRDFYKYLAGLAGGFIYADEGTEFLTLGQFGQPEWDSVTRGSNGEITALEPVTIGMQEIEYDTLEIADYTIRLLRIDVSSEIDERENQISASSSLVSPDYAENIYIRLKIDSNPFLDGFAHSFVVEQGHSLQTIVEGLWRSFHNYGDMTGSGTKHVIRPFHCTAHSTKRFHLGQKIRLRYRGYDETVETLYDSTITSIEWTFRSGTKLACGGEDSRVMADCVRATKADKVRSETRNRCRELMARIKNMGG